MKLFQSIGYGHCATNADHRISFGSRGREACHKVRATWPRSHECHSCFPGHAANAARHEGCILLMSADDRLDLRIDECVKHLVDLCSGYAEDILDSLCLQTLH